MSPEKKQRGRTWARWQIVSAIVCLLASIAMFMAQGFHVSVNGKEADFTVIAPTLFGLASYVIFGINIQRFFGPRGDEGDE